MKKSLIFVVCLVVVFLAEFIGSLFTSGSVDDVLYLNNKPSFTPPNFVFPIVWTALFFLIALSLFFVLIKAKKKDKKKIAIIFGVNLLANALWSVLFFGFQKPTIAFLDLILIWLTILMMISVSYRIDKRAAWLLVPYFLWVSFAGVLNFWFLG